jgi:TolB-like protein/DNA-binding winged helix-turn-helix (wHTH) protein/Tfp pilus assembly protein PilF
MSIPPQAEADQAAITFRVGDLLIDTGRQRVTRDGVALMLPKLSYDLLLVLVRAAPNLVTNDELLDRVWPKSVVSPETLSQRIKLLRDALGDTPRNPSYVEGLRGRGYRLVPTVERLAGGVAPTDAAATAAASAGLDAAAADPAPADAAAEPVVPPRAGGLRRAVLIAGLGMLGLVAAGLGVHLAGQRAPAPKTNVDVVAVQPRAVAVLPFDNLGDAPGGQYIALGIAESVLNRLGSVRELIVIARSSSFSLGTPHPDAREVARKLGVQYVVEGSVQRAGSRLRVNAQLVDAVRNQEMWSLSFDRNLDDVFAMQDEIAVRVAEKLEVSLSKARPEYAAFGTEAYLAYLHGQALLESRKVPDVETAIAEFSRALELAPAFAAAMTDLAAAKLQLSSIRADFNRQKDSLLPQLQSLVDRAIELDPATGSAYYMRAQLTLDKHGSPAQVEADFRKGFELAPNDAFGVFNYGAWLLAGSRYDEALALMDRASLLDPMAPSTHYLRGQILFNGFGRLEEAAASYRQALAVAPDFYAAYIRLAMVMFFDGRLAEAIQAAEKSVAIEPKAGWVRARLVWFYLHLGDVEAARDVQRGFDAADASGRFNASLICYRAGDLEGADRIARRGVAEPDVDTGFGFALATEAVVELALSHHRPDTARNFILSIPDLHLEQGRLTVVEDNWPYFVTLAALEQYGGNPAEARRLAGEILEFIERGSLHGPVGFVEWTRASALAQLGRDDEAMQALERMARAGSRLRWWVTLESDPSFAALRGTPRFQKFAAETRQWVATQQGLVRTLRERGELMPRSATTPVDGC